ncbi:MAG: metallophosphoesterase [Verrucomicrobia bacterium]|nr:metallophosphoesterase [Verrucomicrobiota bacterium]
MNRRHFLKHAGATGLLAATSNTLLRAAQPEAPPTGLAFTTAPSLQNPGADALTVAIGVNGPSTAWVEYGETEHLGRIADGARDGLKPFDALAHSIRLTGLRPGQRYYYRVHACPIDFRTAYDIRRGEPIATDRFSFRTFDPNAAQMRFVVWNDTHENTHTLARLMEQTSRAPADFLAWNGDITNDNYREEQMVQHYLGAGGQPFTRELPLVFARGNHDVRGPAARSLSRFIDLPGGRPYYSFRHGPLGVVVLDAGEDKPDDTPVYAGLGDFVAYRRQQAAWLESELEQPHLQQAAFRIAFCHIPLWWKNQGPATDASDARSDWHRLLAKHHFAALISGHTHQHALFPPDRTKPYAQIIGGGPKPEASTLIRGSVTRTELTLVVSDLAGGELAAWTRQAG